MCTNVRCCMCACLQDPEEIDRHMAGKRFRKLKQQYDEAEAAREARKLLPKDSADAIADRIGGCGGARYPTCAFDLLISRDFCAL